MQVDFAKQASDAFAFLNDAGFSHVVEESPQIVRYRKGELEANVFWNSRSYEVGFQIGYGIEKYSTSEVIRLKDKRLGDEYRDYSAQDQVELSHALTRLAGLIKTYGRDEILGDQSVFTALKQQRQAWSENYALEVLAGQIRPKAMEAFRKGDYAAAASLYEKIENQLSAAETKKLSIAQERSRTRN